MLGRILSPERLYPYRSHYQGTGAHTGGVRHSYQYIEKSVRNGKLENLDDHQVGPPAGTVRPVGAIDQPAKSTRVPFTAEDDRILYEWCVENERNGERMAGNEVYKQLWEIV